MARCRPSSTTWSRSATTIELRGPIGGHFIWRSQDGGPLLLVGGGSGVVPLMSMLRDRASHHSRVPMRLLFSARTFGDVLFRDELLALDARRDGFNLALALTVNRYGERTTMDDGSTPRC